MFNLFLPYQLQCNAERKIWNTFLALNLRWWIKFDIAEILSSYECMTHVWYRASSSPPHATFLVLSWSCSVHSLLGQPLQDL